MGARCRKICPVCGDTDISHKFFSKSWMYHNKFMESEYAYIKCPGCGALYREVEFIDSSILYDENYPSLSLNIIDHNSKSGSVRAKLSRYRDQYAYMNSGTIIGFLLNKIVPAPYPMLSWFKKEFSDGKRIIDIGCGNAQTMYTLKNIGVNAHGAEPYLNDELHYENDLIVEKKFINEISESFDIVYSSNVFEHISNPTEYLMDAKRIMNGGGMIAMEFPAIGSLFDVYRENYYAIQAPQHEILHTKRSIDFLAEKVGLKVLKFVRTSYYNWYLKSYLLSKDKDFKDNYPVKNLKKYLSKDEIHEIDLLWKQSDKQAEGDYYYIVLTSSEK